MNYTELEIGGTVYKLRLTTRSCIALEKALGCNPLQIFYDADSGKLPKLTSIVAMLHIMLQQLQHNVSIDAAYDLFDRYMADGHNMFDIIQVFMEVFQDSGFINKPSEDDEKNA